MTNTLPFMNVENFELANVLNFQNTYISIDDMSVSKLKKTFHIDTLREDIFAGRNFRGRYFRGIYFRDFVPKSRK